MVTIRPVEKADSQAWLRMHHALWPEGAAEEHRREIERYFAGEEPKEPLAVLLAVDVSEGTVGFAELSIRAYAEGCHSRRVAYLEGWYVVPASRRQGIGRKLVSAAADWGRVQGCTEFASDAEADTLASHAARRALGFTDAGGIRCFRKDL